MKSKALIFCLLILALILAIPGPTFADEKNVATVLYIGHGNPNVNEEILVETWLWNPVGEYWTRFWGVQRLHTPGNTGPERSRLYRGYTYLLLSPRNPLILAGRLGTSNRTYPSTDVIIWQGYGVQYTHIGNIDQSRYIDGPVSEGCEVLWRDGGQTGRWQSIIDEFKVQGINTFKGFWLYDGGDEGGVDWIDWYYIWENLIKLPRPSAPNPVDPSGGAGERNGFYYDSPILDSIYNLWWQHTPWVPDPVNPGSRVIAKIN